MEKIHKLPSLLGISAGIIIGFVGFLGGQAGRELVGNMALSIVVFYIFGIYVKKALHAIAQEVLVRKEQEKKDNERKEKERVEENRALEAGKGLNVDLKASDPANRSDSLSQEPVTSFIRQELRKN